MLANNMEDGALYIVAADAILLLHVTFVAFVVFGLVFIVLGKLCAWSWVRNPWFRYTHIAAIGIVNARSPSPSCRSNHSDRPNTR